MPIRWTASGVLALVLAASIEAAIDFEGSVPAGWSESGAGSLSISTDHYRLGSESLKWSWQGGNVMTAAGVSINAADVLDFYKHTSDLWIYCDAAQPGELLTIEFLDGSNNVQWRFAVGLNYAGWRRIVRSFKYDMEKLGGGTNLQKVRFTAPSSGSGNLFFDDLEWVRPRLTRHRDRAMPDVGGYYSSTMHHDLDQLTWPGPPAPATGAELAALPAIEAAYWPAVNGSSPSASSVTNAKNTYASWNIVTGGSGIKGNPVDRDNTDDIDDFVGILARAWHHHGDTQAREMALTTISHLLDQGFAGGSAEAAAADGNGYSSREIVRALLLLRGEFTPTEHAAVKDLLRWRLKRGFFWDPNLDTNKNTDDIHTESLGFMGLALGFSDTPQEQVEELRGLKQYFEAFLEFSPGTSDGIHPDGTSFHHWTHYNHYMYAYGQLAERLYILHGTPFQIGQVSYERFRDACYVLSLFGNDVEFANGLSGRFPMTGGFPMSCSAVAKLATVGGPFSGQTADPKLARMHNRIWGNEPAFAAFGTEPAPQGFWQFNYSPGALFRHGDAVIKVKGFTDTFWGTEIYSNANRYGRYQGYGAVEVLYPGGRAASGFDLDGWDWNSPPGTTTIKLPFPDLKAQFSRQDEVAATRHCGALSCDLDPNGEFGVKGRFGIFGMKFQQDAISATHNPSFTFRKSVFCFDGKILCLGSDIANDDSANETGTTLFQGALPTTSTPTNHMGANLVAFPLNTTWTSGSRWFLDHLGTGYYVHGDHLVKLSRQGQSSPPQSGSGPDTTGDFAKAWISHGNAPSGADYEYVVLPNSGVAAMQQFDAALAGPQPPYTVLQKDTTAHIVHLAPEDAHAYVCFEPAPSIVHGPVTEATAPALLVTRRTGNYLVLDYANPELDLAFRVEEEPGLVTADVRLSEEWTLDSGDPRAQHVPQGDGSTLLRFTTRHGLPVELGLIQFTDFATWQVDHFSPAELADPLISGPQADPDREGLPNLLEYALRRDPHLPDGPAETLVQAFDGSSLRVTFQHDRSRADVILTLEHSTDLGTWTPLPATLVSSALGIETWEAAFPVTGDRHFVRLKAESTP